MRTGLVILILTLTVLVGVPHHAASGASSASPAPSASWTKGCQGKPAPAIGKVEVGIVQRRADDRAVIEARWVGPPRRGQRVARSLELVLPEGAWLVEGPRGRALAEDVPDGVQRWTVGYRPGTELDAVVRLRARVGGRRGPHVAREACVRLSRRRGE